MEENKEIVQSAEKSLTYETLKDREVKAFMATEKKEILDYINENINAVKSVRKFLAAGYSGQLTDDFITQNLQDDAKHLIADIADSKEKCYLGLYKLNEIEHNPKICKVEDFWNWADTVTSVKPYSLQNTQLDLIILKGVDEVKAKDESKYFYQIIRITKQNASSAALQVFGKLISKLVLDYEQNEEKGKSLFVSEAKFQNGKDSHSQEIIRKIESVIAALNEIIVHHQQTMSYRFYFEMNPEYIEQICENCKKIEKHDEKIKWLESLLRNLVTYYVAFAKEYHSKADIESLCDNWKLSKIFSIVFDYSNDGDLQQKILESFSSQNEYLPYLPLEIIEKTFNQNDDEKQRKVLYYLENRYKFSNEKEKKTIIALNDKIILDSKKSIKIREEAFNWIFEELENKVEWSQTILAEFLMQCRDKIIDSSIQATLSFTQIIKKCYEAIENTDLVNTFVKDYVIAGENKDLIKLFTTSIPADNLNDIIAEMINNRDDKKTPDICKYLEDAIQKSVLTAPVWKKALAYLTEIYKTSSFKEEISVCLKNCINNEKVTDNMRNEIFEKFIPRLAGIYAENPDHQNGKIICDFIADINDLSTRKEIFKVLFNKLAADNLIKKQFLFEFVQTLFENSIITDNEKIMLLSEYFECGIDNNISDIQLGKLKKYINYIWDIKDKFIYEINSILDIISKSSNADLIKHTILKGWGIY